MKSSVTAVHYFSGNGTGTGNGNDGNDGNGKQNKPIQQQMGALMGKARRFVRLLRGRSAATVDVNHDNANDNDNGGPSEDYNDQYFELSVDSMTTAVSAS